MASAVLAVDLAPYLKRDTYGIIKISPDGTYYAATLPLEDRTGLVVLRRADKHVMAKAVGTRDSVVADFWWANNERIVIAMAERMGSRDRPQLTGELHALSVVGGPVKVLVGAPRDVGMVETIGGTHAYEAATLIDPLPEDARNVLISVMDYGATPRTRVEKLDVYDGHRSPVATAPVRGANFVTDGRGEVRFAAGAAGAADDNSRQLYYREARGSDWRLVNDEARTGHYEMPLGFSTDGTTAYLQVEQAKGADAIVAWDPKTGTRKELLRDPVVDPYKPLFDRNGNTIIGAQYMNDGVRSRYFDEGNETTAIYRRLEKAFPGSVVDITSFTRDGRLALVVVWNDRTQGDFYLYDTQIRRADGVFVRRIWFDPEALPRTQAFELTARDGLPLHGYLTTPRGKEDQALPMVVMPHGGPFGYFDEWAFDDDVQLLAEAGYAVLRVNYRGSGNYGSAFRVAGAREWGGKMQDDLTDATHWAIDRKIADPSRICLYGASYGGYAALMGVAREPSLYRCAAGYVGVYDLEAMHRDDARIAPWARNWANDWIGDRGALDARSPVNLAKQIKVPVFLAAGGKDTRAPIAHSKKMERALRDAGVPVETLYIDSEDHGFYTEEHRRAFYTRLLDFLSRNLGGAKAQ
jgi:dipeptidyl aminopeptidase/acylaminoacyl peptidase